MATARVTVGGVSTASSLVKLGVVLAGYVAAFLLAWFIDHLLTLANQSPDANGGMQAFGDLLRFVGLFGVFAIFPTALGLYFLRTALNFWTFASFAALLSAGAGVLAALLTPLARFAPLLTMIFGLFGTLKVLGAPLFGFAFLVFAMVAPNSPTRWRFLVAAGIEFAVGAYGYFFLLVLHRWIG